MNIARALCTIGRLKRFVGYTELARPALHPAPLALIALALAGCDPVINIAGADFPSWLVCIIAGAILTACLRPLLLKLGIEPYLGPPTLVYLSLAVLLSCVTYLMFFNRI